MSGEPQFSEYVVYADESGTASMAGIDPDYSIFVLAFVVIEKRHYAERVVPNLQTLKFDFFGHDQIVLHEHELRRQEDDFAFLRTDKALREGFLGRVNDIVTQLDAEVIAAIVDKTEHQRRYDDPWDPYRIALQFCMEKLAACLRQRQQSGRIQHVVFESRGTKEDRELELEFRRIVQNESRWGYVKTDFSEMAWRPIFASKQTNSAGLQLADLFARPIGLNYLRPDQPNRAFEIIEPKLRHQDYKVFP